MGRNEECTGEKGYLQGVQITFIRFWYEYCNFLWIDETPGFLFMIQL